WKKLPASERKPGAIKVGDPGKTDTRFSPKPPAGGLILDVHARILERDQSGKWKKGSCKFVGGDQPSRDHLWLTTSERKALIPNYPKKGEQFSMPQRIADRLLRYHLVDNTRGEPPMWQRDHVRSAKLTWTVEEATAAEIRLRLDGSAVLS